MNYKMMGRFNAMFLGVEAVFLLPAFFIALGEGAEKTAGAFALSFVLIAVAAGLLLLFSRGAKRDFFAREGLVCVGVSWIFMSLFGCLPFWLSGEIPSFIDAFFEMVSGFTTTGASVVPDVEALSYAVLYWRSFSHWLGGMGVLVFLLAIVPISGKNEGFTMHLLRAESPGPNVGKLVPRMRQTAAMLYLTYIVLTVINFIFLVFDMPVFDALCTAFGTAGTGGFGIKNDSMASYSPYIQTVTAVFMLLFSVNFGCYFLLIMRRFRPVLRDEELRLFLVLTGGGTIFITLNLLNLIPAAGGTSYATVGEALRHAFFQVASLSSSTGFSTANFDLWPAFSKAILLILLCVGACAGSTGGGLKVMRLLLLFKVLKRNVRQILRPSRVTVIQVNGQPVDEKTLSNTCTYFAVYIIFAFCSFALLSLDGFSLITNFSAVLACFNNTGPGFEGVGPSANFGDFSILSKLVLIVDMLAGRLEIFPILVLAHPDAWRRR